MPAFQQSRFSPALLPMQWVQDAIGLSAQRGMYPSRNLAIQETRCDLIGDQPLTIEPAAVTVYPSGDTAMQDELAGPLFNPPSLCGGSVVKTTFRNQAF